MGDNRFQSNAEGMFFSEEEKRYIEKYSEVFEEQKNTIANQHGLEGDSPELHQILTDMENRIKLLILIIKKDIKVWQRKQEYHQNYLR